MAILDHFARFATSRVIPPIEVVQYFEVNYLVEFAIDPDEQFDHLNAAPIAEAVIQWTSRSERPLEPDEFRQELAAKLPEYPTIETQKELRLENQVGPDGSVMHINHDFWRGTRLTSADKLNIGQFGRHGLVFSRLRPYEDWETFVAEGTRLWKVFVDLCIPADIERLGVRFINQVSLIRREQVRRYLSQPPDCLKKMGLSVNEFLHQSNYRVPGHPYSVRIVRALQPSLVGAEDGGTLIVDIDVTSTQSISIDDATLDRHLQLMRWLKDKAFFSLMTPAAVKSFKKAKK